MQEEKDTRNQKIDQPKKWTIQCALYYYYLLLVWTKIKSIGWYTFTRKNSIPEDTFAVDFSKNK